MSRREGQLFVGRLSKTTRVRDLEEIFEPYGRLSRCDIKYGAEMAYAFVDYEDKRDAEDCIRYENGREVCGSSIIVEWTKGNPRRPLGYDECYRCHRPGHWARDCPEDRFGYRRSGGGGRRYSPSPRRKRSYSRSRSRERRRRSRSRSRDRRRRSRSRDKRSRSRDRKSRDKKSRSKSRDSKSKSRSRSKSRSLSKSKSRSPDRANGDAEQAQNDDGGSPPRSRSGSPN